MDATTLSRARVIAPEAFFRKLRALSVSPFVGVPCSLIAGLIAYAADHPEEVEYLNPAHESHAMAVAAGSSMGSRGATLPMVFMQNAGFMNILNPLTSLHQVYRIPAILLVTWRGEGGEGSDAPEHDIVGRDMEAYFRTFRLPYRILSAGSWEDDLAAISASARATKTPAALCVRKGLFGEYETAARPAQRYGMTSREAIAIIKEKLAGAVFLSTTGMISRESFAEADSPDFFMVGSMGLLGGIAAGCAAHTDRRVVALDGDGAVLMHMGLLPFIGSRKPQNLVHAVIDNESYSSTGGQPTVSPFIDFPAVAKACGYRWAQTVMTRETLEEALMSLRSVEGPALLHVKVKSGADHGIGRVSDRYACPEVAERFMGNFSSGG